jgi:hypothetical protein
MNGVMEINELIEQIANCQGVFKVTLEKTIYKISDESGCHLMREVETTTEDIYNDRDQAVS